MFRRILLILVPALCAGLLSCDQKSENPRPPGSPPAAEATPVSTPPLASGPKRISARIAPFDIYPSEARYGFTVLFSEPVVAKESGRDQTPQISIKPPLTGVFEWASDSAARFRPQYPIAASDTREVDLRSLALPKDGTLEQTSLQVNIPEPRLGIVDCSMHQISANPITQRLTVRILLNNSLDSYQRNTGVQMAMNEIRSHVSIKRQMGETEDDIPANIEIHDQSLELQVSGNDMLRPGKDGVLKFTLTPGLAAYGGKPFPGASCEVPFKDIEWHQELSQNLADSEAKKVPLPAALWAHLGQSASGRETLTVSFVEPARRTNNVPHKRAAGEILEKGVTITPAIEGKWQVSASPSSLEFVPAHEWTPGSDYRVTVDPGEFSELDLKETATSFSSYRLSGSLHSIEAGTVPEDQARRVVSGTLDFNYPVRAEQVEKIFKVSASVKGKQGTEHSIRFSVLPSADSPSTVYVKSEPLRLEDYPVVIKFFAKSPIESSLGGRGGVLDVSSVYELPSRMDIFSIKGADLSVAKSSSEELQRILTLTTSEDIEESIVTGGVKLLLLPDCKQKENAKVCSNEDSFYNEKQVVQPVEEKSEKVALTFVSRSDGEGEQTFSYSFQAPGNRQILIELPKGITSKLGFPLAKPYREVFHLKDYPKRLNIMLDGALLSVSGSKRLGVIAQNVRKIHYRLSRVKATDLHHLIYVTGGSFKNPNLKTSFTFDDMAQPFEFAEELPDVPSGKPAYTSVDFTRFVDKSGAQPRGLFFLEVNEEGKQPKRAKQEAPESSEYSEEGAAVEGEESSESGESDCAAEEGCESSSSLPEITSDSRLVLLTDLGLVVKRELAGGDRVYVASFRKGEPVAGAEVRLISRNGGTLFSAKSDANGQVVFPKASDFAREKEAVLYVAEKDGDLTYLPYQRRDRMLDFSRFEVGGIVNSEEPDALRALLFTDRGIYRPGEKVSLAMTVRTRDFLPPKGELPLIFRITDPKGQSLTRDTVRFSSSGIADYHFETNEAGLTGTYRADLIIPAKNGLPDRVLAGIDFRVEEFEPDRLAISAEIAPGDVSAFKKLEDLKASLTLKNLFGAPAVANKTTARLRVEPWGGALSAFPGFSFRPENEPGYSGSSVIDLGEAETDDEGQAEYPISIPEVSGTVLDAALSVEGFEKDSGRSVAATAHALVTDLSMLLGVHASDPLGYVEKGALRRLDVQAINLAGAKVASGPVAVAVEKEVYKNVLVKQANGVFKYESARKLLPVKSGDEEFPVDGKSIELETQEPGNYEVSFRDHQGTLLNRIHYSVMGEGNDSIKINRNANLELTLNKASYAPEEQIELSVRAPYPGFGVVTIEREKVLSTVWFKMEGTTSVQTIKLPAAIVGNAYVTVLLARSWDSKDIYLPPLSYASVPVKIAESVYLAPLKVSVPAAVKPGSTVKVDYSTGEPGSLIVYAVDEGILQFAHYRAPEPLKTLLPKRALETETRTALDLVMPDYSIVQSVLSTGGDEGGDSLSKFQNPFKKKNRPPLAVWSGIRTVDGAAGSYSFDVPDYFDGSVKVFAYFVGQRRVAFAGTRSEIRGDYVIKPNLATFAAPADTFDLPVEVTSTIDGTQEADVSLDSKGLEILGEKTQHLSLQKNKGLLARFRVRASDTLGEATVSFRVQGGKGAPRTLSDSLSIRPANPLMRTVRFGAYDPEKAGDTAEKKVGDLRQMYPQLASNRAAIGSTPALFVDGLAQFMEQYPYGCSEQISSKGFIQLYLLSVTEDAERQKQIRAALQKIYRQISGRMNADGSIGYWRRGEDSNAFVSVYAAHLLVESQAAGIQPPVWITDSMKRFLAMKSGENQFGIEGLFPQAYALYLRARMGEVVTKQLDSMVGRLKAVESGKWQGTALSWFIASTYHLLNLDEQAKPFLVEPTETKFSEMPWPLSSPILNAGFINYLKVKHFGGKLEKDIVFSLLNRLDSEAPDSLSASTLALGLFGSPDPGDVEHLSITSNLGPVPLSGRIVRQGAVPVEAKELSYQGAPKQFYFYSLVQSGFDKAPARQGSRTQGVVVARDIVDDKGESVSTLHLGETYHVVLRVQSDKAVRRFALQDLLPAGFEPDLEALKDRKSAGGEQNAWSCEQVDVRDDRLILFGDLPESSQVFSYPVKPTVRGTFVWPGLYGEAMYDPRTYAWEKATSVTVE